MKYDQFVATVRDRGQYQSAGEAAQVAKSVLQVLAGRISAGEARDLADQLPQPLADALRSGTHDRAESYGVEEFCRRIAERTGAGPAAAQWDASAVLTAVADAVSGGELNQVLTQLPSGYAVLFGKIDLS